MNENSPEETPEPEAGNAAADGEQAAVAADAADPEGGAPDPADSETTDSPAAALEAGEPPADESEVPGEETVAPEAGSPDEAPQTAVDAPEVDSAGGGDSGEAGSDERSGDREGPLSVSAADHLRSLPVPVVVVLAEKRIDLGQLLQLSTGAMITFDKSCEEPLTLHVNDFPYCRGEAVKVGENFGLKIDEIGVKPVREPRVVQP